MSYVMHCLAKESGVKQAESKEQIPKTPHFAMIIFDSESMTIPGDERSRTNPGHGYPEHTVTYSTFKYYYAPEIYQVARFIELLEADDRKYHRSGRNYQVIHVDRILEAKTEVKLQ